jgi:hypothetical protein
MATKAQESFASAASMAGVRGMTQISKPAGRGCFLGGDRGRGGGGVGGWQGVM